MLILIMIKTNQTDLNRRMDPKLLNYYKSAVKHDALSLQTQFTYWYLTITIFSFNGSKYYILTLIIKGIKVNTLSQGLGLSQALLLCKPSTYYGHSYLI